MATSSRPPLRSALPVVRDVVRVLRESQRVDASPSWETFRWLTSDATVSHIERLVRERLNDMHGQKHTMRVLMHV